MRNLVNVLEGAVALNTAQASNYMATKGGEIFPAKAYVLRLRVEFVDGTL
jgi:hypothetical protein